jgi:PIN domain nuclease of toxin-antitoxin system
VNLLLDTHVVLWALGDPERLAPRVRDLVTDPRNTVAVSAVSVWEVEIKRQLGTLLAPDGFASECLDRGFDELPIGFAHAQVAGQLPRHHDDPFDRMLIAQATVEGFTVVTADDAFRRYDVRVMAPT